MRCVSHPVQINEDMIKEEEEEGGGGEDLTWLQDTG